MAEDSSNRPPSLARSTTGLRRFVCPYCGLRVLGDDARLTIHHEAPVCARFGVKLEELGLRPVSVEVTMFVDEDPNGRGASS
jgi:hypothetical protein